MAILIVKKRDGREVPYDAERIFTAISKANDEVIASEKITEAQIREIIAKLEHLDKETIAIEEVQDFIESQLILQNKYELAKKYIIYRYSRALLRKANTTDESILALIGNSNKEVGEENANKDAAMASTQRDLIAGEVSKDVIRRLILPEEVSKAHDEGAIHFHDTDYFLQYMFNCCLINIEDMLDNGTVMNEKMIESPKSFQVACTIMTQVIAAVASNQYGGQSISIKYLGKYLRKSADKYRRKMKEKFEGQLSEEMIEKIVEDRTKEELKSGVQTIQYQVNTLMTTNGQSPFVTMFLHIDEDYEYVEESALIIEEILRQRIEGIKNEEGVYVTPAFPKLVYVLDECNVLKGGKYDHITRLAIECSAKRMYPDYISAKKMRENYEGNVFSPMGCRSFLSPWQDEKGNYKFEGRFNQGVVSLNIPQIAILAKGDEEKFFEILDERMLLVKKALLCRHERLKGTRSDISPIHWQHGAIARLKKGEKIDKYLMGNYSTLSMGYIGIYEAAQLITWGPHTQPAGEAFAKKLMNKMRATCDAWKEESGLWFGLYGTPAESLCYRFAKIDKERFGEIENITDKGYYTNSYHVDVREDIDALAKFTFEAQFQTISSGGAISYVEIPNMKKNLQALETLVKFIYENIQYAEFNTKSDFCHECRFDGEILVNEEGKRECPQCHNMNQRRMNVTRRTCGYLGEKYWNVGKTKEIASRVLHL